MNKTLDILEEMLYAGMIDKEEYEAERTHYFYLVTSVHEFEEKIMEKKIQLESIKKDEKVKKVDPRIEKLLNAFEDGIISVEEFILLKDESKRISEHVAKRMNQNKGGNI